jgi:hypothetical protein
MKNRTTNMTTGPIKNKRTTKNTTVGVDKEALNEAYISSLGNGVSETSRPTISGGRVIKVNSMNRDNNTMTSNKVRLDRSGNIISNQVTDYNKIPFKNKAIDLINRVDYNIGNAMNRGVEQIKSAPSAMRQDLREIANKAGRMLTKENYNKGDVTSEFDGNVVSGVSRTRPTMSGGIQEKVKYDMPGGGKRIEKKRYNEEGYITDKKIKDRKINPR